MDGRDLPPRPHRAPRGAAHRGRLTQDPEFPPGALPGRLDPRALFPAADPAYRVHRLDVGDGEHVRVVETGPVGGPPALFVHGWGCAVYEWRRNLPALAAAGWRAIAFDMRGHGLSDKPEDPGRYTQDAMVAHLIAVLDALGIARAPLVAHSLGGQLALSVALRAPHRVTRLALAAPVGFSRAAIAHLGALLTPPVVVPLLPRLATRLAVRVALGAATGDLADVTPEDVEQYWGPSQYPGYARALRHLLHGCRWQPHDERELRRMERPALVAFGTRDRLVNAEGADKRVHMMPGAHHVVIPGAGHVIPSEAADVFNALLLDFLRQGDAPAGDGPAYG